MKEIKNIQLSIICPENWDGMQPVPEGRHCANCNRKVVDLTDKSDTDLLVLKADNPSGLCGRFKLSQTIYHKAAAALIISSGIGLSAQAQVPQQSAAGKNKVQVKPESLSTAKPIITEKKDTIPQYIVGAMPYIPLPEYPGGENSLLKFLKENIVYPPDLDKDGTVYVQYKIDTLGNVVEPKILRGLSPSADNEVLRVVKMLKYKPYKPLGDGGTWNLPVKFIAPKKKDEK